MNGGDTAASADGQICANAGQAGWHTLVTGATRGIGRAIVDRLVADGEPVVGIARTADPTFPAPLVLVDLQDSAASARALRELSEQFQIGRVVNNAGINRPQALGSITADAYEQIFTLNCRGAIDCTQALLPGIRAARDAQGRPAGRIVMVSSRSLLGRVEGSVYGAAKAALVGLTRSWALELAAEGVTVNCVAPGPIATEMFDRNNPPGGARRQQLLGAVPMRRMGEPEEVAAAVAYFLSGAAAFTTGQTLFVCGGASITQVHL
jgi:3-oxoacyl-[acyl-carrier protein] reductase